MHRSSSPFDNRLLASLDRGAWLRLQPHLERVFLNRSAPIYAAGEKQAYAYFPTTLLASLMQVTMEGDSVESALIGSEGMLGIGLLMGGGSCTGYACALNAGEAYRVAAPVITEEFNRAGNTMRVLLRFTQALLAQTEQNAICARHHLIIQRVAFCLLQQADCSCSNTIYVTQEQMANRLGVRREGVNEVASALQRRGLIRCTRGKVILLDRPGLVGEACGCYGVLRNEVLRLLPVRPHYLDPLAA